jgi:DNA polymerase-3 subunit chi
MTHPRIDFYILKNGDKNSLLPFLCKLIEKALNKEETLYIHTQDKQQAEVIDDLLWTFNDISFIPHAIVNNIIDEVPPVLIGYGEIPAVEHTILINLNADIPSDLSAFQRVIEIVTQDAEQKNQSRLHYKTYQAQDLEITSHEIA